MSPRGHTGNTHTPTFFVSVTLSIFIHFSGGGSQPESNGQTKSTKAKSVARQYVLCEALFGFFFEYLLCRQTPPHRKGDRYFFSRNTGLQRHAVHYTTKNLNDEPTVLIDPNVRFCVFEQRGVLFFSWI